MADSISSTGKVAVNPAATGSTPANVAPKPGSVRLREFVGEGARAEKSAPSAASSQTAGDAALRKKMLEAGSPEALAAEGGAAAQAAQGGAAGASAATASGASAGVVTDVATVSGAAAQTAGQGALQGLVGAIAPLGLGGAGAVAAGGIALAAAAGGGGGGGSGSVSVPGTGGEPGAPSSQNTFPQAQQGVLTVTEGVAQLQGGRLTASDADNDTLTFALTQPVDGLTLNADGTYTFDASKISDLKTGQSRAINAAYTVTDGKGGSASANLVITVLGKNDAPTAKAAEQMLEQGQSVSGKLLATDLDAGSALTFALAPGQALLPGLTLRADGSYTFAATAAQYVELSEGDAPARFSRTFMVTDDSGLRSTASLTFIVTGKNDAPTGFAAGIEDVTLTRVFSDLSLISGSLSASDPDKNDAVLTYKTVGQLPAGFSVADDGLFELDASDAFASDEFIQAGAGEVFRTLTVMYTATDAGGLSTGPLTYTFELIGENDAPVFVGGDQAASIIDTLASATVGLAAGQMIERSGELVFEDVDIKDELEVSVGAAGEMPGSFPVGYLGTFQAEIDAVDGRTVRWNFSVDPSSVDALSAGQTLVQAYTIFVSDPSGVVVSSDVTVTLTGANDTPVIVSAASNPAPFVEAAEAASNPTPSFRSTGMIEFMDADIGDALSVKLLPVQKSGAVMSAEIGTFQFTLIAADGSGQPGRIEWTYDVTQAQLQQLGQTDIRTQTYEFEITDSTGSTVKKPVVIELRGSNDAPVVVQSGAVVNGVIGEEAATVGGADIKTVTGGFSFTDADLSDTHTITFLPSASNLGLGTFSASQDISDSKKVIWSYAVADSAIDFLAQGESRNQIYTIDVSDGVRSFKQTVTVTLNGVNDIPVLVGNALLSSAGVSFNVMDPDLIDTYSFRFGDSTTVIGAVKGTRDVTSGQFSVALNVAERSISDGARFGVLSLVDSAGAKVGTTVFVHEGTSAGETILAGAGANRLALYGFGGDDNLTGTSSADYLNGGTGNDTLGGVGGADTIDGGEGNDILLATGLEGGGAVIDLSMVKQADGSSLIGIENIFGTTFGDFLKGSSEANMLDGNSNNDILDGAAGNDTLVGGTGNDTLIGGLGSDVMIGGDGNDVFGANNLGSAGQSAKPTAYALGQNSPTAPFGLFTFGDGLDQIMDFQALDFTNLQPVDRLDVDGTVGMTGPNLINADLANFGTLAEGQIYVMYGVWNANSKSFTVLLGQDSLTAVNPMGGFASPVDALVVRGEGKSLADTSGYVLLHDLSFALQQGNFQ